MKSFAQNMGDESDESPSPRRAWIEIYSAGNSPFCGGSPSPRRAWIEMTEAYRPEKRFAVALPTEGVD